MEIIEADNTKDMPKDLRPISLAEFMDDHRKRWVMRCSEGDIVLKRISYLDLEHALLKAEKEHPGYEQSSKRAAQLWTVIKAGGELPPEHMEELNELSISLSAPAKMFSLKCFERPKVETLEEFDALMGALTAEETAALQLLLAELSSPSFGERAASPMLMLAQRFDIKMPEDLNIETMTPGQVSGLVRSAEGKGEG
jgi:hypothetical protein